MSVWVRVVIAVGVVPALLLFAFVMFGTPQRRLEARRRKAEEVRREAEERLASAARREARARQEKAMSRHERVAGERALSISSRWSSR
jgi:hypothetical protein